MTIFQEALLSLYMRWVYHTSHLDDEKHSCAKMQVISKLEALPALAYFESATKEGFKLCMEPCWAMDLYENLMTIVDPLLKKKKKKAHMCVH